MSEPLDDPRTLTILTAEHASLTPTRGLTWDEAFSRTNLSFTTLSAAAVALALVGQATRFGSGFDLFALTVLPLVLFLGLATLVAGMVVGAWYGRRSFARQAARLEALEAAHHGRPDQA